MTHQNALAPPPKPQRLQILPTAPPQGQMFYICFKAFCGITSRSSSTFTDCLAYSPALMAALHVITSGSKPFCGITSGSSNAFTVSLAFPACTVYGWKVPTVAGVLAYWIEELQGPPCQPALATCTDLCCVSAYVCQSSCSHIALRAARSSMPSKF